MPIYFFDVDDGSETTRDEDGRELSNDDAARDHGARALAHLARDHIPTNVPQKNITMWVRSEDGEPLLQLSLSFAIKSLKQ